MKTKKIVRYRIPISMKFPATHPKAGEPTEFAVNIIHAVTPAPFLEDVDKKLHTIRANYKLWAKRFEKINRGDAVLQLYCWRGRPYRSKTATICLLSKKDGIGIQMFEIYGYQHPVINGVEKTWIVWEDLAKNDGLSLDDFKPWFKGYDHSEPMAIIHFTNFRY